MTHKIGMRFQIYVIFSFRKKKQGMEGEGAV